MKIKSVYLSLFLMFVVIQGNAQPIPITPSAGGGLMNLLFPSSNQGSTNNTTTTQYNQTDSPSINTPLPETEEYRKHELEKKRLQLEQEIEELRAKTYKTAIDSQNLLIKGKNLNIILQKEQILLEKELELVRLENIPSGSSGVFGHHFFRGTNFKFYSKATDVVADENYVIGVGDKLNVSIWGSASFNKDAMVDNLGYVAFSNLVKANVKGKTVAQAREILMSKFRSYANMSSSNFQMTVVGVRKINVNITGEVFKPGTFNVLASNSVFNILSSVGGPTDIGSVRSIYIKREGKIIDSLDVYEYIFNPETNREIYLQNNDFIIVPTIQKIVTISGGVKRPATYELKFKENLNSLFKYAAGTTVTAYTKNLLLKRIDNNLYFTQSINYDSLRLKNKDFLVKNGDEFEVKNIIDNDNSVITLLGEVNIPGTYSINSDETISTLIKRANGTMFNTSLEYAYIIRTNDNLQNITIPFLLGEAMKGNPLHDIKLQAKDKILIFKKINIYETYKVTIKGGVREPNTFDYTKGLKLLDYFNLTRGFTESAIKDRAILVKTDVFGVSTQQLIDIQSAIDNPNSSANFELEPRDEITIFDQKSFIDKYDVTVYGEVRNGGKKLYKAGVTLQQILFESGGFTFNAENAIIEIVRTVGVDKENVNAPVAPQLLTVGVLKHFELDASAKEMIIFPGDMIFVRRNPNARPPRIVNITGEVMYPGQYVLVKDDEKISDLIIRAGGLRPTAFMHGTTFKRKNQDSSETRVVVDLRKAINRKNSHYNYLLFDKDKIEIPRFTDIVQVKGSVRVPNSSVGVTTYFKKGRRAKYYIKNFAGGFERTAIRRKTTVLYADGSRKRARHYILFIKYPKLKPGSIIEVPDRSNTPRKKLNLGESFDKTLFRALAIATVIATVRNLTR